MTRFETFANGAIAQVAKEFFQPIGAEARLEFALVHINLHAHGLARCELGIETRRNFHGGADPFVGNLFRVIGIFRNDFHALQFFEFRANIRRILSAEDHYLGHLFAGFANLPDHDHQQTYG